MDLRYLEWGKVIGWGFKHNSNTQDLKEDPMACYKFKVENHRGQPRHMDGTKDRW